MMDTRTPPPITTTTTTTPKSPEPESETPTRIQPAKPISFSNGTIKHYHNHNHNHIFTYKECLKNHAASLGSHALDGCGEFMPSPSSLSTDPTSLKCAACNCHRNFHRRVPERNPLPSIEYQPQHRHHPPPPQQLQRSPNSSSPPPISSSYMLLSLSGTNNNNNNNNNLMFSDLNNNIQGSRKRFRTKFSQFQKDKMHEFADRVNWKMQKRDEDQVREFCRQIGVDKSVLKVWMHNNKNNRRGDLTFSGTGTEEIRKIDNGGEINVNGGGFESDSGGGGGGNVNGSSSS